jgi:hypothetical protein
MIASIGREIVQALAFAFAMFWPLAPGNRRTSAEAEGIEPTQRLAAPHRF